MCHPKPVVKWVVVNTNHAIVHLLGGTEIQPPISRTREPAGFSHLQRPARSSTASSCSPVHPLTGISGSHRSFAHQELTDPANSARRRVYSFSGFCSSFYDWLPRHCISVLSCWPGLPFWKGPLSAPAGAGDFPHCIKISLNIHQHFKVPNRLPAQRGVYPELIYLDFKAQTQRSRFLDAKSTL